MELSDILNIVSSRIYHMEEYAAPKSFKYQLMAKKFGCIACYNPEEQFDCICN